MPPLEPPSILPSKELPPEIKEIEDALDYECDSLKKKMYFTRKEKK